MLFKRDTLRRIRSGEIRLAFRKWRCPTVKRGGTLKTAVGLLGIDAVEEVSEDEITDAEAVQAGHESAEEVRETLREHSEGKVFRVRFKRAGEDPRIELRQRKDLSEDEWREVETRLGRLDKASRKGAWTEKVLRLIGENEGTRAGDLAPAVGQEKDRFKGNVRKLKNLGLTESLEAGYRLSPRGGEVLKRMGGGK